MLDGIVVSVAGTRSNKDGQRYCNVLYLNRRGIMNCPSSAYHTPASIHVVWLGFYVGLKHCLS